MVTVEIAAAVAVIAEETAASVAPSTVSGAGIGGSAANVPSTATAAASHVVSAVKVASVMSAAIVPNGANAPSVAIVRSGVSVLNAGIVRSVLTVPSVVNVPSGPTAATSTVRIRRGQVLLRASVRASGVSALPRVASEVSGSAVRVRRAIVANVAATSKRKR